METRHSFLCRAVVIVLMMASAGLVLAAGDDIQFEEVSVAAGVDYIGPSWGSMWGDFDEDGNPDVWVINHYGQPSLFVNMGDGTFIDIYEWAIPEGLIFGDTHGAAWADFDNDGDQDLYQLADGGLDPLPARLLVNMGGYFEEMGAELGLDYPLGRGRMPNWLDFNQDGLLDMLHATSPRADDWPTALFQQNYMDIPGFTEVTSEMGLVLEPFKANDFNQMADLTGDGNLDLMIQHSGFPAKIYDISVDPFLDIQSAVGLSKVAVVVDAAIGDLDGDLDNDLFMVHGELPYGFAQIDEYTVEARFIPVYDSIERGLSLNTTGDVTIGVWPTWSWTLDNIFIGSGGMHPEDLQFTLSPTDPNVWGIYDHTPGTDTNLYVGYDQATQVWQIVRWEKLLDLVVESTTTITDLSAIGWDPEELPRMDHLMVNSGSGFIDGTLDAGISVPSSGHNVLAADFDNDMDLDLFVCTTGPVLNDPDILYVNDGTGNFTKLPDAGGAAGTDLGRGDAVSCADYNNDGFMDLLVTNGTSKAPFDQDGPTQFFKNLGNDNHWIEIDLVGVTSNRDGIGSQIRATAGGVTQLREQDGGIHYRAQDHQRIHFGLGSNTMVDELHIRWPNGNIQLVHDIPADQIIEVIETNLSAVPGQDGLPAVVQLMGCYPNPFNPSTVIKFSLTHPQPVTLTIHDAAGRLVNRLVDGEVYSSGVNEVVWGGRDESGRQVSSGVYFYSLSSGSFRETKRMVLVK